MAKLQLGGGCTFCNAQLCQLRDDVFPDSKFQLFKQAPLLDAEWDSDTVLCINFNSILNSGNIGGYFSDIDHFKIYKKLSRQPELLEVYTTPQDQVGAIEDLVVGSRCPYTYYIRPIRVKEGEFSDKVGTTIKTRPYEIKDNIVRVMGLIPDEKRENAYYIDDKNTWHISLNAIDAGFTNTLAKTFNDTLNRYQKEVVTNGAYRTFDIEGLLGQFDCATNKYIDTYDDIVEWEQFMGSGELKLAVDIRGIITVGDIDTNSFQYNQNTDNTVSVKFSFRQLDDISNITVYGRQLPANPVYYDVLAEHTPRPLEVEEHRNDVATYLATPKE